MRTSLAIGIAALVLTGCSGLTLEQLPAPKGVSGPTYHLTAQFHDVQNLSQGAKVKLGGVVVGEVTSITTKNFQADVGLNVSRQFQLARDSTFEIRFTTPLGEDYVSVTSPSTSGRPVLAAGDVVAVNNTSDAPGIEDTFAALSVLLNGGGLDKLHTIASELDAALKGRTGSVRDTLVQLQKTVANLDAHKADIDHALDGLNSMAASLQRGMPLIERALSELPAAIQVVADETAPVRRLLTKVGQLGDTVNDLLQRSQDSMIAEFNALRPTLDSLRASESQLIPTFNSLINFGQLIDRAAPGDYLNISATLVALLDSPPNRPRAGGATHSASTGPEDAITTLLGGAR